MDKRESHDTFQHSVIADYLSLRNFYVHFRHQLSPLVLEPLVIIIHKTHTATLCMTSTARDSNIMGFTQCSHLQCKFEKWEVYLLDVSILSSNQLIENAIIF